MPTLHLEGVPQPKQEEFLLSTVLHLLPLTAVENMEWKNIEVEGYKEFYQVSTTGRVRSLNWRNTRGANEQKLKTDKGGYQHARLQINKVTKQTSVHRLVALTFIPNDDPINKVVVNHIDGNKRNNDVSNLEWVTKSENLKRAYNLGLRRRLVGELNPNYKHGKYTKNV